MGEVRPSRITKSELEAEGGMPLPAKEVISLLNLNVDLDLALDLAAPIDLAIAANANVAAPIDAAVSANILTLDSISAAQSTQAVMIDQMISGEAIADAPQDALVDQSNDVVDGGTTEAPADALVDTGTVDDTVGDVGDTTVDDTVGDTGDVLDGVVGPTEELVGGASALLSDGLLNIDVQAAVDADLAAPIAGAVAANANVAAPISAAVSANIGSIASESVAVADQTAVITQSLEDVTAHATADQTAEVIQ